MKLLKYKNLKIKKRKSIEVRIAFKGKTFNGLTKKEEEKVKKINKFIDELIREQKKIIKKGEER